MKLFTILFFAMASIFVVSILDARYKIEVKVEGGLEGFSSSAHQQMDMSPTDGSKYYLKYTDPQPNGIYIGEPKSYQRWPTGTLRFAPGAHVFVDRNQQTVRLEELKPTENYRLKTLVTTHSEYQYMYMSSAGWIYYDKWNIGCSLWEGIQCWGTFLIQEWKLLKQSGNRWCIQNQMWPTWYLGIIEYKYPYSWGTWLSGHEGCRHGWLIDSAYTKLENTFCWTNDQRNYGNVAEAIRACDLDNECRFVSDFGCDNGKSQRLWLCHNNATLVEEASTGTCLYEKPGVCTPADGTQGSCPDNQKCYTDGFCNSSCSPADNTQGNCPHGQLCYIDGTCNNDLCAPNPCNNNGKCKIFDRRGFTCDCSSTGFTGPTCTDSA